MDEQTSGLILRIRPLTETSLVIHWLTPELGRIATVAKGARRPKSPFRGKLDLFFFARISFQRSRHSDLHHLREVVLLDSHPALRRDLNHLRQASYCAALIEQFTEAETPLPVPFELFTGLLAQVSAPGAASTAIYAFELKLLDELGLFPDLPGAPVSAGAKQVMFKLQQLTWTELPRLKLSEPQAKEIGAFLHTFLIHTLGKVPKGRSSALVADRESPR